MNILKHIINFVLIVLFIPVFALGLISTLVYAAFMFGVGMAKDFADWMSK